MFTDGPTEARTPEGGFGLDGVQQALGGTGPSAQDVIDAVRLAMYSAETVLRDDVAALAVRAG